MCIVLLDEMIKFTEIKDDKNLEIKIRLFSEDFVVLIYYFGVFC